MLLSRLQADCEYYLGWGNRNELRLYYNTKEEHIKKMFEIYNELEIKPKWLKLKTIKKYAKNMLASNREFKRV
jgi:NAD(P)H-flavin reductase